MGAQPAPQKKGCLFRLSSPSQLVGALLEHWGLPLPQQGLYQGTSGRKSVESELMHEVGTSCSVACRTAEEARAQ